MAMLSLKKVKMPVKNPGILEPFINGYFKYGSFFKQTVIYELFNKNNTDAFIDLNKRTKFNFEGECDITCFLYYTPYTIFAFSHILLLDSISNNNL